MKVRLLSLRLKQWGARGNDDQVHLFLFDDIETVCGRETKGGGAVVQSCSKDRDRCAVASHKKFKVALQSDCLCPFAPKKRSNQVRLEPSLLLSHVPLDEVIELLLLEEKSAALWQTHMEACKALERDTGRNELGQLSGIGANFVTK
jgi:hypothetical protein